MIIMARKKVFNFKENGDKIAVTNENRQEYVDLYTKHLLYDSIKEQFSHFSAGFKKVCDTDAFKIFTPEEVEILICGLEEFDFKNLEKTTTYDDGYTKDSQVIKYLWEVLNELSVEQQKKFLFFTTGSDRVPIGGLGKLQLVISKNGTDSDKLPTAHTCFNHLLLPDYGSKQKLTEKLLTAIQNSEGFGLR